MQEQLTNSLGVTRHAVSKRLHETSKIKKERRWMPHQLTQRQLETRRTMCEILIRRQRRKSFLFIITEDEKWTCFDNSQRKRSWTDPGDVSKSIPKQKIHGKRCWSVYGGIRNSALRVPPTWRNGENYTLQRPCNQPESRTKQETNRAQIHQRLPKFLIAPLINKRNGKMLHHIAW